MNQKVDPRRVPQDRQGSQEGHRRVGWRTEGMAKDQGDLEGGNRRRTALKAQQGSFVVAASTPKGAGKGKEGWECQTAARARANQSKMDNKDNKEGRKEGKKRICKRINCEFEAVNSTWAEERWCKNHGNKASETTECYQIEPQPGPVE
ncbi:hypothetical protein RUM44_000195 [Polyplax serrata]|uniref:Uncharacterized protein n=1 Tax=Polyplax serrata TaxID=468196 RepID=A0ABR1B4S0_POLSC